MVSNDTRSMFVEAVVRMRIGPCARVVCHGAVRASEHNAEVLVPTRAVQRTGDVARVLSFATDWPANKWLPSGSGSEKILIRSGLTGKEALVASQELRSRRSRGASMNPLAAVCVKRPVFATVLILVLVVFGVFGYLKLGLDRFPNPLP